MTLVLGIEYFTIVSAMIMEGTIMTKGSEEPGQYKPKTESPLGRFIALWMAVTAILYLVVAVCWCFSSSLPVQIGGTGLILMTCLGIILRRLGVKRGQLYIQTDAMLSLALLALIFIARIKGV